GLTGLVSIETNGSEAKVVDYLLSCRVMGRKVEETMVHMAVQAAREAGASTLRVEYQPTPKNKPCLSFWQGSGFSNQDDGVFGWDLTTRFELPGPIELDWEK